jgi:hypothetical protein
MSGNVYIPHPAMYPWVDAYISELITFDKGPNDDQVDATTQCLVHMRERRVDPIDLGSAFGGRHQTADEVDFISESYWS